MPSCTTHQSRWDESRALPVTHRAVFRWELLLLLVVAVCLCASRANAGENGEVRITPREKWSTVFGNSMVKLRFDVSAENRFNGIFRWSFSANGRTIEAGERDLRVEAGRLSTVEVSLTIPAINDGVIFPTQLSVSATERGQRDAAALLIRPITIFPHNVFFQRSKWLKELSISLFDPPGQTANLFESVGIPFKRLRNLAALDAVEAGMLIVGEGVSFRRNRSSDTTLSSLAARGVPVLCLAPKDGNLTLPVGEDAESLVSRMVFRGHDVITTLDKRLDSEEWMSSAGISMSRITLRPDRDQIVGEISHDSGGWPWLELRYRDQSTLVYCGFGIVNRWDSGPTPRFLIVRLMEYLTDKSRRSVSDQVTRRRP